MAMRFISIDKSESSLLGLLDSSREARQSIRSASKARGKTKKNKSDNEKSKASFVDQEVWKREEGYWFGELTFINSQGKYDYNASNDPTAGQYDYRNYYGFINLQVSEDALEQRNVFVRPSLEISKFDNDGDSLISQQELDLYGFTSIYDYQLSVVNGRPTATPLKDGELAVDREGVQIAPYDYTKGTEATFTASQTVDPETGLFTGTFSGIPTVTQTLGDDTVVYRAGSDLGLFQNQLTTLPDRQQRVRTAQGFNPFGGNAPTYGSYYRETKIEATVDKKGYVTSTAFDKFLAKLEQIRSVSAVDAASFTNSDHFITGLEEADERGVVIEVAEFTADSLVSPNRNGIMSGTNSSDVFVVKPSRRNSGGRTVIGFDQDNGDRLALPLRAFSGAVFKFAVAANPSEYNSLMNSDVPIVYRVNTGELIYNENRAMPGAGRKGGVFVTLEGAPGLDVDGIFLF